MQCVISDKRLKRKHRNMTNEQETDQFLRRARRDVRAMGVVTFGVSFSAITASDENK